MGVHSTGKLLRRGKRLPLPSCFISLPPSLKLSTGMLRVPCHAGFHNFAVSFTVVSVLTGLTGLYGTGFAYGGPVVIIWGWCLVSFFTLCVALSMAEICSAYPTSGALYFWSAKLAGPKYGPIASWVTGW